VDEVKPEPIFEVRSLQSSEEVASEQIEDILATLNEMGITVVETEEAEAYEEEEARGRHGPRSGPRFDGVPP
jgi:RNA polymerase primary sigma factor